jgi:Mrp family chromosome partitioning ATPase
VLGGEISLRRAIQDGPVESLSLLTAGPTPENPADWLASSRMSTLLQTLRDQYDLILIDLPPVLAVPDATILAERLDGLVFVVGMHRATPEGARLALQHLEATHGHVLGMALTGLTVTPDRPLDDAPGPDPDDVTPTPTAPLLGLPAPGTG